MQNLLIRTGIKSSVLIFFNSITLAFKLFDKSIKRKSRFFKRTNSPLPSWLLTITHSFLLNVLFHCAIPIVPTDQNMKFCDSIMVHSLKVNGSTRLSEWRNSQRVKQFAWASCVRQGRCFGDFKLILMCLMNGNCCGICSLMYNDMGMNLIDYIGWKFWWSMIKYWMVMNWWLKLNCVWS